MLSLPSKPWKKIALEKQQDGRFLITVLSPLTTEAEFEQVIGDDLQSCVGEHDVLVERDWDTKTLVLTTGDIKSFKRKLIYHSVIVDEG